MLDKNRKFKLSLLFALVSIIGLFTNYLTEQGFITAMTIIMGGYALSNVAQKGVIRE